MLSFQGWLGQSQSYSLKLLFSFLLLSTPAILRVPGGYGLLLHVSCVQQILRSSLFFFLYTYPSPGFFFCSLLFFFPATAFSKLLLFSLL